MRDLQRKFFGKPAPAKPGEINYSFVDRFTLVHFGIGIAYGLFGLSFYTAFALAILWEVVENPLKVRLRFLFPHATADKVQNMLGDVFAVSAGWLVASLF